MVLQASIVRCIWKIFAVSTVVTVSTDSRHADQNEIRSRGLTCFHTAAHTANQKTLIDYERRSQLEAQAIAKVRQPPFLSDGSRSRSENLARASKMATLFALQAEYFRSLDFLSFFGILRSFCAFGTCHLKAC